MKDVVIKAKRIKIELWIFLLCLIITNAVNIYSIIKYGVNRSELYTQLPVVFLLALILYAVSLIIRGLLRLGLCAISKKK
jgi:hypothetical protein